MVIGNQRRFFSFTNNSWLNSNKWCHGSTMVMTLKEKLLTAITTSSPQSIYVLIEGHIRFFLDTRIKLQVRKVTYVWLGWTFFDRPQIYLYIYFSTFKHYYFYITFLSSISKEPLQYWGAGLPPLQATVPKIPRDQQKRSKRRTPGCRTQWLLPHD